jgi:hypothetical protein
MRRLILTIGMRSDVRSAEQLEPLLRECFAALDPIMKRRNLDVIVDANLQATSRTALDRRWAEEGRATPPAPASGVPVPQSGGGPKISAENR